jgi:hypothetical protein
MLTDPQPVVVRSAEFWRPSLLALYERKLLDFELLQARRVRVKTLGTAAKRGSLSRPSGLETHSTTI